MTDTKKLKLLREYAERGEKALRNLYEQCLYPYQRSEYVGAAAAYQDIVTKIDNPEQLKKDLERARREANEQTI